MLSIRITSRPPSRIRKWNQLSQFKSTSTKVIPIEKIEAGYKPISLLKDKYYTMLLPPSLI